MEVANVSSRPNYRATKRGALIGAASGIAAGAGLYTSVALSTLPLKNGATMGLKRAFIEAYSHQYSGLGIDMSKVTVSKVISGAKTALKQPLTIAFGLCSAIALGAGIGFAIDAIKNHSAKNVSDTKEA